RKAALVWRRRAVDHERKRPLAALKLLRTPVSAALGGFLAVGGRPRQRKHVKIELAGCVLPVILCGRRARHANQRYAGQQAKRDQKPRSRSPWKINHW